MNYNFIMKFIEFFKIKGSYKTIKISLLSSMIVGLISYILIVVYRVADPDTVIEGLTYYINATWAIVGCGRWMLPIINILSGNVIMPLFIVLFYCFAMWLSAFLICKMWNIDKPYLVALIACVMTVTPSSISQLVATYMGICFALACLLSTVFVYVCFTLKNKISWLIAIICIVLSLALYQSYVSYIACLTIMTIFIYCFENKDLKEVLSVFVKVVITAIIGCLLYFISNKVILTVFDLESSSRLASFSFADIITNLIPRIIEMYKVYFNYFNDSVMNRKLFYLILFVLIIFIYIVNLLEKKNILTVIIESLCLVLIPLSSNLIGLITPDNPITILMSYQNILVIPFTLYLTSSINIKHNYVFNFICITISICLCWTHVVSANATYQCYKMSYDYTYSQYAQVIYDIQHFEGYEKDKTPVIIAGFFEDDTLRKNIKTYNYSVELFDNLVFWETYGGATYNMQRYVLQYFGLDFIESTTDQYQKVVNNKEFENMNIWPNKNSIEMIDDYLVVKIGNNYIK